MMKKRTFKKRENKKRDSVDNHEKRGQENKKGKA